jgi:hypothetical protein
LVNSDIHIGLAAPKKPLKDYFYKNVDADEMLFIHRGKGTLRTQLGNILFEYGDALLPNWKHIPVGYHGRASSIFVSGTNFHRPKGQINATDATPPIFSATKRLDIELEMATIIGKTIPLAIPLMLIKRKIMFLVLRFSTIGRHAIFSVGNMYR